MRTTSESRPGGSPRLSTGVRSVDGQGAEEPRPRPRRTAVFKVGVPLLVAAAAAATLLISVGDGSVPSATDSAQSVERSDVPEEAPSDSQAGVGDLDSVAEETDPAESRFDSGVPTTVTTLPAAPPGSTGAFLEDSHTFAVSAHNLVNGVLTEQGLPPEAMRDLAATLGLDLERLSSEAQFIAGVEDLSAANLAFGPVVDSAVSADISPQQLIDALQSARDQWLQALATVSPEAELDLPSIVPPAPPAPDPSN